MWFYVQFRNGRYICCVIEKSTRSAIRWITKNGGEIVLIFLYFFSSIFLLEHEPTMEPVLQIKDFSSELGRVEFSILPLESSPGEFGDRWVF